MTRFYGGMVICVLFDLLLLALTLLDRLRQSRLRKSVGQVKEMEIEKSDSVAHPSHESDTEDEIVSAFTKALDNQKLRLRFEFKHLCLTTNEGTPILSDISGKINPGKVTAVMGPSG